MKKKMDVKFIIGCVLIGLGLIGFIGVPGSDDKSALIMGSIMVIAAGVVLLFFGLKKNKQTEARPIERPVPETITKSVDYTRDIDMLPVNQGDLMKVYQYDQKLCIIRDDPDPVPYIIDKVKEGHRQLIFEFEPDNPHDDKAVMIKLDDQKIGYVYRGQTQDMIHSYFKSHYEVAAHINTVIGNEVMYKIAFYKPKDKCKEYVVPFKNKKFVENTYEGEILEVEYDELDECFTAYIAGETVKLPKRVEEYARKHHSIPAEVGENCESLIFYK